MTERDGVASPDWLPGLGEAAFNAYVVEVGGRTHDDKPIPAWSELGNDSRAGWIEAGKAAVRRAIEQGICSVPNTEV